ncbi:helix-turn-helix domain-containing protein [Microbispora sitophila]|uniref:helix-turn-helix domain-containing protein n=1 Tax=Microbispora sitophila TaxID=2771537 RepID=UPI0021F70FA8|nr:LysR family transcriptional regulator [Microbispora sitophila]
MHFGRTAARLGLSPARVTQAIQKQERQIGAPLFERNNRAVRLTPVGRQLRDDLQPLYAGLQAACSAPGWPARASPARCASA